MQRISSRELSEWVSFSTLEPFGFQANYLGHAVVAQTIIGVNTPKGKKIPEITFPDFDNLRPKEQTPEQMIQFASMYTESLGGKDLRGEE